MDHGKPPSVEGCNFSPPFLLLHGAHLRPDVAALDGRVDLGDVLQTSPGKKSEKICRRKESQLPHSCDSHVLSTVPSYVVGLFR